MSILSPRLLSSLALAVALGLPGASAASGTPVGTPPAGFRFVLPVAGQLSLTGPVDVELDLPERFEPGSLELQLDGAPVAVEWEVSGRGARASLPVAADGAHALRATVVRREGARLRTLETRTSFETVTLAHPDECEVLNGVECLLPYPSSRFLAPADTPTGWRLEVPEVGMPIQFSPTNPFGAPVDPTPLRAVDGFSPVVQILMHFPGGVDLAASRAPILLPERRTYDARSLDRDSPTLLVDLDTGERVVHFVELDVRAAGPERQILFLRPGESLVPGHRYGVAVRNLVDPDGEPVAAEPVFAALRDRRPTDIPAVEARRARSEQLFRELAGQARRSELILAFDFVVQSDEGLTGQMLSMRDQAFAWLEERASLGEVTFEVDESATTENDCSVPGTLVWRIVQGTYQVPLFLTADPVAAPSAVGFLNVDEAGHPVAAGVTNPPYTIAIPCIAREGGLARPLVIGHGLFGNGRSTIRGLIADEFADAAGAGDAARFAYIAGATDFRGLSGPDVEGFETSWIAREVIANLSQFSQLPDRLRQGQLHTLVLARMMKQGLFNAHPAFQTPAGAGVFPGPEEQTFYFGASLGGIMGLMFAALSPDIERANVDVPAINFSLLLQRATPFLPFQVLLALTGISDPMQVALGIGLLEELWVRGESAGYARHITRDPLPGTNAKRILMTEAWLDQQVSNLGTEVAARTLGLPNLSPGSLVSGLVDIPDRPGPLDSALVVYDTGSFDLDNPEHTPFVPPLANLQAEPNDCDPHGLRGFIPASIDQLFRFLQPDGRIENFCDGACDAQGPLELPGGAEQPCDPLAQ